MAHHHALRIDVTTTGAWPTILATTRTPEAAQIAVDRDQTANPGKQDANGYGPEWEATGKCTCPRTPED